MRFYLIPINGTTVISNLSVVVTMLDREVNGFLERDGIQDMKTVCGDPSQRIILQNQPVIRASIFSLVEIPSAREIIFGTRTMDRWLFLPIHKYLFISIQETECAIIRLYTHIYTHYMAAAFGVQDGEIGIIICIGIPVPVSVKVTHIRTDGAFKLLVIYLVIKPFQFLLCFIHDYDPGQILKRHWEKTGIPAGRHPKIRGNILPVGKSASKEVT